MYTNQQSNQYTHLDVCHSVLTSIKKFQFTLDLVSLTAERAGGQADGRSNWQTDKNQITLVRHNNTTNQNI